MPGKPRWQECEVAGHRHAQSGSREMNAGAKLPPLFDSDLDPNLFCSSSEGPGSGPSSTFPGSTFPVSHLCLGLLPCKTPVCKPLSEVNPDQDCRGRGFEAEGNGGSPTQDKQMVWYSRKVVPGSVRVEAPMSSQLICWNGRAMRAEGCGLWAG